MQYGIRGFGTDGSKSDPHTADFGSERFSTISAARAAKRLFDIIVATSGLILFSPIFLFALIAIKLESHGPIFCPRLRYGLDNQPIMVYKFRTTASWRIEGVAPSATCSRRTRFGRLLRASAIDALPQLINVLVGEMSIVGPSLYITPPGPMFEEEISLHMSQRCKMRPGLTGLTQIHDR